MAFIVNGEERTVNSDPDTPLPWVLRDDLRVTGAKFGCSIAQCGACTVHIDNMTRWSCVTPISMVDGSDTNWSARAHPEHPRPPPLVPAAQGNGLGWSVGEIREQLKDPERTLAELHEHNAKDGLVCWAWNPGKGREPAPGSQEVVGELTQVWIDTDAMCPES